MFSSLSDCDDLPEPYPSSAFPDSLHLLSTLPIEILSEIILFIRSVEIHDLSNLCCVCHPLRKSISESGRLWETLFRREIGFEFVDVLDVTAVDEMLKQIWMDSSARRRRQGRRRAAIQEFGASVWCDWRKRLYAAAKKISQHPFEKLKVCFVGYENVGKSCLCSRLVDGTFQEEYVPTIGCTFAQKRCPGMLGIGDIDLGIWRVAGRCGSPYHASRKYKKGGAAELCLRGANLVFIVFSPFTQFSLKDAKRAVKGIRPRLKAALLLVANKMDLVHHNDDRLVRRHVSEEMMSEFIAETGLPFIEVSARIPSNVEEMFRMGMRLVQVNQWKE